MTNTLDLDAYLGHVGWHGPTDPSYATLTGVLQAHMARIPFENLDVLLGRPVRLDLDHLTDKLVLAARGGYCFEHGTLFAAALEQMGFALLRHTARVVLYAPRHASPRTHMFLTVAVPEGRFAVDPGFGGLAPRVPVPLVEGAVATAGLERHWFERDGPYWVLRALSADRIVDCWASTLEVENAIDFELGNHYTATHPASPMVNRLMLRALSPEGRVTVVNRDLTIWRGNIPATSVLSDRAALGRALADHFAIDLPEVERLRVPAIPEWS